MSTEKQKRTAMIKISMLCKIMNNLQEKPSLIFNFYLCSLLNRHKIEMNIIWEPLAKKRY